MRRSRCSPPPLAPASPLAPARRAPRSPGAAAAALVTLAALASLVVLVVLAPSTGRAGAQTPTTGSTVATTRPAAVPAVTAPGPATTPAPTAGFSPDGKDLPWLLDPRVDRDLSAIAVDTLEFRLALARYRATETALAGAIAAQRDADAALVELGAADRALTGDLHQATRRRDKSAARLEEVRASLRQLAVDDYIRGGTGAGADTRLDLEAVTDSRRQRVVVRAVRARQLADERENAAVVAAMTERIDRTGAERDEVRRRAGDETRTRERALADQARLSSQVTLDARGLADARLTGAVTGLDFAFVALDAYYKAAKRMAFEAPACRIRWTLVAAISRTEGRHGTYGGATLDANGTVTKPIIGIALDGANGTAVVADTDGAVFDGDPAFDRAVGPMQFIPGTWNRWGRDGNADGVVDPQNMYDAALAAAAYLCRFAGIDQDDGMRPALLSYNNSAEYAELVMGRAHAYELFVLPAPPP